MNDIVKRGKGRPASGAALSAAERKRLQRARDRVLNPPPPPPAPVVDLSPPRPKPPRSIVPKPKVKPKQTKRKVKKLPVKKKSPKSAPSAPPEPVVQVAPPTPPEPVAPPAPAPVVIDLPEPRPSHVRKQRSDSVTAEIAAAMQGDKPEFMPPVHLNVPLEGLTDWRSIIASRNRDDWTHGEISMVGTLVKCLLKLRLHTEMLEAEGDLIYDHLGRMAINPRFQIADTIHKQIMALMKSLNITGKRPAQSAGGGNGRVFSGSSDDPDGLLA